MLCIVNKPVLEQREGIFIAIFATKTVSLGFFALAIDITDAASTATSYIWCSLLYLFITVNGPVISAIPMANYVFIGPSHKKVKFFVFLCRIIKEVFSCFSSVEKPFSAAKRVFRTVILEGTLFCCKSRNGDPELERNYENHSDC